MSKKRGSFSGGLGFVFAAAGSAVGLGNLWRFPYYAAKYGGGTFIFIYIILALTFGFSLLTAEIAIGRKTKLSPILAYKKLCSKFSFLGYLATLVPTIIIPYYCVIGGWVTKYMCVYAQGLVAPAAQDNFFSDFISDPLSPIVFFLIFMLLSAVVIMLGVNKGIERLSKFLMPVLLVLTVGISIYTLTLPNAMEGVSYYLIPDFSKLSIWTFAAALGQLFFSMSIAMGIMVTYGSYTKDEVNLTKSVNQIEIFDTAVALLAGLMVVPAVYVFSGWRKRPRTYVHHTSKGIQRNACRRNHRIFVLYSCILCSYHKLNLRNGSNCFFAYGQVQAYTNQVLSHCYRHLPCYGYSVVTRQRYMVKC